MGLVKNVVGWIAVAALLAVFAGVLAVASGYIMIGSPGAAAAQIASGDVTTPNVSIDDVRFEGAGGEIGQSGFETAVTTRFDLVVNNTPNAVGGSADEIDYDVAVARRPEGPFQRVGTGVVRGLEIPPGSVARQESTFDLDPAAMAEALGGSFDPTGDNYMRVSGNASFAFGPFSFSVPFSTVERIQYR